MVELGRSRLVKLTVGSELCRNGPPQEGLHTPNFVTTVTTVGLDLCPELLYGVCLLSRHQYTLDGLLKGVHRGFRQRTVLKAEYEMRRSAARRENNEREAQKIGQHLCYNPV